MSEKHVKGILDAVEQSDVYTDALAAVPDDEKVNVKATVEGFATMLAPVIEALEKLEQSEEIAQAVRVRLAEKLRAR
jgi:hypothetical protein